MSQKERKKYRDYLNKRRNRLIYKGADYKEVSAFFGGKSENFGKMSTAELKEIYNMMKQKGATKVVGNHLYTKSYYDNVKKWYGHNFAEEKLKQGFKQSLKSPLNDGRTAKEIEQYRRRLDNEAKERYLGFLKELKKQSEYKRPEKGKSPKFGVNNLIGHIRKMNSKQFGEFLRGPGEMIVGFENILRYVDTRNNQTEEHEPKEISELLESMVPHVKNFWEAQEQ